MAFAEAFRRRSQRAPDDYMESISGHQGLGSLAAPLYQLRCGRRQTPCSSGYRREQQLVGERGVVG